jgi:hypothetical protein
VEIRNICGTEAHLNRIIEIGKNQMGNIEYLFMEFDDDENTQDNPELARQYVEAFREYYGQVKTLRFETIGDRNFTLMIGLMMEDPTFPWFESVNTIKVYQIRNLRDMELFKVFLTKFRSLRTLKGITEEEFNPLDAFIKEGKRVHSVSWTIPEREKQRKQVLDFLQFNQTVDLKLYGGCLEKVVVNSLFVNEHT